MIKSSLGLAGLDPAFFIDEIFSENSKNLTFFNAPRLYM
jgi:hypothetical protein